MKTFSEAKKIYDSVEIPSELEKMVKETIARNADLKAARHKRSAIYTIGRVAVAACATLLVVTAINFITPLSDLSIRDNHTMESQDSAMPKMMRRTSVSEAVSKRIDEAISECLDEAKMQYDEFVSSGEITRERSREDFQIRADFTVCYESEDIVSFIVTVNESSQNIEEKEYYYNVRALDASDITLQDFLGDEYKKKIESIGKTEAAPRITEEMNFYINERGNAVVIDPESGEKYEIAK